MLGRKHLNSFPPIALLTAYAQERGSFCSLRKSSDADWEYGLQQHPATRCPWMFWMRAWTCGSPLLPAAEKIIPIWPTPTGFLRVYKCEGLGLKPLSATTIAFAALVSAYLNQFPVEVTVHALPDQDPGESPGIVSPRSTCRGYTSGYDSASR